MPDIEAILLEARGLVPMLPDLEIRQRAAMVEADFARIALRYVARLERYPNPFGKGGPTILFPCYQLLGSESDIQNARSTRGTHKSMSGAGLNKESLFFYSKISKWAHATIPAHWPDRMIRDLRDPNKHLNTLSEVWWLSKFRFVDWSTVRRNVSLVPPSDVDWTFTVNTGIDSFTMRCEVKRRVGDFPRAVYKSRLRHKSTFEGVARKFPACSGRDVNIACIQVYGGVDTTLRIAAKDWLAANPHVHGIAIVSPSTSPDLAFFVLGQPGYSYLTELVSGPDEEDACYVGAYWYPRKVPGIEVVEPSATANPDSAG